MTTPERHSADRPTPRLPRPPGPSALVAPGSHGAFLVTRDGAPGVTPDAARSSRYLAVSRGVRVPADSPDLHVARTAGALMASTAPAVAAGLSAALVWRLPVPAAASDQAAAVTTAVPAGAGRQQRQGVRGRRLRLPEAHVTRHNGVSLTSPGRTWLDCAELVSPADLTAMGDVILRRQLASRADLADLVRWGRGRRGVVTARAVLPILDERSGSPGESRIRSHLVLAGLPRPEVNVDIHGSRGWLARADLVWARHRVIVEYDGRVHEDERQRRKDALRRNMLQDEGWLVIVLTADDLRRPERMIDLVATALRARNPRER